MEKGRGLRMRVLIEHGFLLVQVIFLLEPVVVAKAETAASSILALQALRTSLKFPVPLAETWTGYSPCDLKWPGLTCNTSIIPAVVTELDLSGRGLSGEIPPVIGNLASLRLLNLSSNAIAGSIPPAISDCFSISVLSLSNNNLSGGIPGELSLLANLSILDLSNNELSGKVPDSITSMPNLTLRLEGNSLCGEGTGKPCDSSLLTPGGNRRNRQVGAGAVAVMVMVVVVSIGFLMAIIILCRGRWKRLSGNALCSTPTDGGADNAEEDEEKGRKGRGGRGWRWRSGTGSSVPDDVHKGPIEFGPEEVKSAMGNFGAKQMVCVGRHAQNYRGTLNGAEVFVKRLNLKRCSCTDSEFLQMVKSVGGLQHPNVVSLVGYTKDPPADRTLVFEFVPNGTLAEHLHGQRKGTLDWQMRVRIAVGVAKGLAYLYEGPGAALSYHHVDLTSKTILLDQSFHPKVAPFGPREVWPDGSGSVLGSPQALGTLGYGAPEYVMLGQMSPKSIVYTFGVMLLELLSGRVPVDTKQPSGQQSLVTWMGPHLNNLERLNEAADPSLQGLYPPKDLVKFSAVAAMCLQPEPAFRPNLSDVVAPLESLQSLLFYSGAFRRLTAARQQPHRLPSPAQVHPDGVPMYPLFRPSTSESGPPTSSSTHLREKSFSFPCPIALEDMDDDDVDDEDHKEMGWGGCFIHSAPHPESREVESALAPYTVRSINASIWLPSTILDSGTTTQPQALTNGQDQETWRLMIAKYTSDSTDTTHHDDIPVEQQFSSHNRLNSLSSFRF